jgi:hypothetical protein
LLIYHIFLSLPSIYLLTLNLLILFRPCLLIFPLFLCSLPYFSFFSLYIFIFTFCSHLLLLLS